MFEGHIGTTDMDTESFIALTIAIFAVLGAFAVPYIRFGGHKGASGPKRGVDYRDVDPTDVANVDAERLEEDEVTYFTRDNHRRRRPF